MLPRFSPLPSEIDAATREIVWPLLRECHVHLDQIRGRDARPLQAGLRRRIARALDQRGWTIAAIGDYLHRGRGSVLYLLGRTKNATAHGARLTSADTFMAHLETARGISVSREGAELLAAEIRHLRAELAAATARKAA
jgi:hypothetical protein